ncbi:MAG: type IV toxin-antitoxin system AbiEi family antitoxin [Candidatus Cloacimonadota bacterium]|nr:type IV toxin-antitoxin system AbiEi family antitoxin [Candidatus Cloacimonadota bacterium]
MKNNEKIKLEYKSLSKDEVYLISRAEFEKQTVITTDYAKKLFTNSRKASKILDKLTRKERLIQIERGKYIVVPLKAPNQLWTPNEFIIAKLWMSDVPYYIGYFTIYNYWGFTEQVPQTVFVLNTKKSRSKIICNVRYKAVKISEKKYYGIKRVRINQEEIYISDKERTLVDFIYNPIGSFANVKKVLEANLKQINFTKFIKYLISFPVISVRRRAGYILEQLGYKNSELERLQKNLGNKTTYTVLNPRIPCRKGKISKTWKVIVNG